MKLITTLDEVKEFLPITMTSYIEDVKPFISQAERVHIVGVIGKAQYDALAAAYVAASLNVNAVDDKVVKEALIIAQKIAASLGYYYAIPTLSVKIGGSGIQVFSNADTKQAFKWQVDDVKTSLINLGYGAIEELLAHLEANPDKFTEYINSEEYAINEQYLIENAKDFSRYFEIKNSRYTFQCIAYIMGRIEEQTVKRTFGAAFFDSLKADDLEGKKKELVNQYLKPGIALLTAAKALKERVITFENGVASINLLGNYDAAKSNIPATRDDVQAAYDQLTADGNQFLTDGMVFITENTVDFEGYEAPAAKKRNNIINDRDKGVFAI